MIAEIELFLRRLRNRLSRTAWAIRHFKLAPHAGVGKQPGLILVQIDGLSQVEMERAMDDGRLPFLRSLLRDQEYSRHSVFSGLPSSTPAAQGEVLYGVPRVVPAFCYYDKTCGRIFSMFEGDDAREIQGRLEEHGTPLLREGSAYADLYTGGAAEAHFCITQLGWPDVVRHSPPLKLALLMLLHVPSLLRIAMLMMVELMLALSDCVRGLIARQDFWQELKFVPSRVAVCIVMREVIVVRAAMDLMRGLPVVHMNFLGYDEQAHRRGPDSAFAHWTLKGIDRAIRRVYRAGRRSMRRDYDTWIYSDHGQLRSTPYERIYGRSVARGVSQAFDETVESSHSPRSGIQLQRARMLKVKRHRPETQPPERWPIVTALGPFGCIYLKSPLAQDARDDMARRLVDTAGIPMVFCAEGETQARVWTEHGCHVLPDDAGAVLGDDHPFARQTAAEMVAVCRHPQAGDFFISGFRPDGGCLTFPNENGSHGGVSGRETQAFAILPADAPLPERGGAGLRLGDIHVAARRFLKGDDPDPPAPAVCLPDRAPRDLRVLTYNVHNCAGMDGTISPHRVARVIAHEQPDIVALQEVDVGRSRSAGADQAALLARYLRMDHHFHPAMQLEEERYGDAVLSRFPMELVKADLLPYRKGWLVDEARGALWVRIHIGEGLFVNVFNTHFGIGARERRIQADALVGDRWLRDPRCRGAVIVCGDFNSTPGSQVHAILRRRLHDAQEQVEGHKPLSTFAGRFPLQRIDHVFVNDCFDATQVNVPRTHLARLASDHLPLLVRLELVRERSGWDAARKASETEDTHEA